MAKLYLAASFEDAHIMCGIRTVLETAGHRVVSRWIDGLEKPDTVEGAIMDYDDLKEADFLIVFAKPRGTPGGGRHVEFGIAIEASIPIIIVGETGEHVFHHWPGVQVVADVNALLSHRDMVCSLLIA